MNRPKFPALLVVLFIIVGLLAGCSCCQGGLMNELATGHQSQVKKGEQVSINENISGKPWPKVWIYRTVNATPEEVAAVFCDYDNAKAYVPNVLKSKISNRLSACTVDIDYGLDVPILPDEFYTTRNTLKASGPDGYRIDWKLVRAVQTKDSVGCLRIEPFDGKALICYENLVTPGSSMAGLLKGKAIQQMGETVAAIAARVESQKTQRPEELKREVEALREMLKAEAKTAP
jgi:hypothetical protein